MGAAIAPETAARLNMERCSSTPTAIAPAGILVTEGRRGGNAAAARRRQYRFMPDYTSRRRPSWPRVTWSRAAWPSTCAAARGVKSAAGERLWLDIAVLGAAISTTSCAR